MEGLRASLRRVVSVGVFEYFADKLMASHLQYVDDTMLVGMFPVVNILILKVILRSFEFGRGIFRM